jgi:preprotein translocase subunit SecD
MLHFSRAKAAAILLTTLVICGFAVPNFLPDETVKSWPVWAQRRLVLGPDLQGGTSLQLEVDRNDAGAQLLTSLRREVRSMLHEARIGLVRPVALRADGIDIRPLEGDFRTAFAKLRELSQPFNGVRDADVVDAGGGLIRVIPTAAAVSQRVRLAADQAAPIIEHRINELGLVQPTVLRQGADRIVVQVPSLHDPQWLLE